MRPVVQTLFGQGKGNCFAACLASVLELRLEQVPNFCVLYAEPTGGEWFKRAQAWLRGVWPGLGMVLFKSVEGQNDATLQMFRELWPDAYAIVGGPGPRGCDHCVVYRGGELAHDPHPDGTGLLRADDLILFVVDDPTMVPLSGGAHE